jgi:crotonobetainyl-CoA:carnitine CoA-transferase CaiB-like acyl-CoA transferase
VRRTESAHPSIVPFQAFQTADGWMTVACAKQKFWVNLCRALEREDLLSDDRFAEFDERSEHRDALLDILRPLFRARETEELVRVLSGAGVPCGAVNGVLDALEDPQVEARDAIAAYEHPTLGEVRVIASPFADAEYRRAPFRGEHTEELT